MSILEKDFDSNFTQIPNEVINDNTVSNRALGMYTFMASKPNKWEFSLNGLVSQRKEAKTALLSQIEELIEAGYLEKIKDRDSSGRQLTNKYKLYRKPKNRTEYQKRSRISGVGQSESENDTTSNTKLSNTKKSKTELSNTHLIERKRNDFNQFRENFKNIHVREPFYVDGFGYDNVPLITNYDGLILHGLTFMFLKKEDSLKIWSYLYKTLKDDY